MDYPTCEISQYADRIKSTEVMRNDLQLNDPGGFCLGVEEEIIVADMRNHRIQVFHKNGDFKFTFGTVGKEDGHLWFPCKVAIIPHDKRIIVADRFRLQLFSEEGIFIRKISYIIRPVSLTVTNEGLVVIVQRLFSSVCIMDEFESELYMRDYKRHRVAVFTTAGDFQRHFGRETLSYPSGICIFNDEVFVAYCPFEKLMAYDPNRRISAKNAMLHPYFDDVALVPNITLPIEINSE